MLSIIRATPESCSHRKMGRCYAILITTLFFSAIASAQTRTHSFTDSLKSRLNVGITGGFSLNRFTKDQPQTGYNTGYSAGLLANYRVYKGFSLQLEVNSLQQGGQLITFKDDTRYGLPENFETKNVKNSSYTFNSLEIPLLVNYTFALHQSWKPALYAGASYAYNFNVTESYQKTGNLLPGEDIIATADNSQGATSLFNRNRLNFVAGANALLPLTSKLKLLIDFRYLNGLTPARENYSYMEKAGFGSDIRSNSFIARLGLIASFK